MPLKRFPAFGTLASFALPACLPDGMEQYSNVQPATHSPGWQQATEAATVSTHNGPWPRL